MTAREELIRDLKVYACSPATHSRLQLLLLEAIGALAEPSVRPEAAAIAAIRQHNEGCEVSCKARRPSDLSGSATGCGYQKMDGTLIYPHRRCPDCPLDWKIDFHCGPQNSSGGPK